jgi:methylenetetrahydrofolate dehydrogenase (NADP+)/methenyltetrahydrofolate cyclohydrolase
MSKILDGTLYAGKIREEVKRVWANFTDVLENLPDWRSWSSVGTPRRKCMWGRKHKACLECEIRSDVVRLPEDTPEPELLAVIDKLNTDASTHGILVQLPPPLWVESGITGMPLPPNTFHCFSI